MSQNNSPDDRKHHLDRRVDALIAIPGDDDDLLDTKQLAEWFSVSPEWVEGARHYGFGPKFIKVGPRMIRYRRSDVLAWLKARKRYRVAREAVGAS